MLFMNPLEDGPPDYSTPQCREAVLAWKRAGAALEAVRRKEIAGADTQKALAVLEEIFELALRESPPRPTSGLIEQQRWFQRLKK
jgi:hypothetical protein